MEKMKSGNMSDVYKNGNYVHRVQTKYSKSVQQFLMHLEFLGFRGVPYFEDVDDEGREILTYVEGDAFEPPKNADAQWKLLVSAAQFLRNLHDISASFDLGDKDDYFIRYEGPLESDVMCHNDFAPYNSVFKDGSMVGLFDFDTVSPGPREWDIVYALYRFVPLNESSGDDAFKKESIAVFLDAYGYEGSCDLASLLVYRIETLIQTIEDECMKGNEAFIKMKQEGHSDFYQKEIVYLKMNAPRWF